ncbi:hypothetical protein ACJJV6_15985 [Arthrobacter nitrophenolicus]|uniref:Uncharacterized protein n=2 Tax=Arthrobacter nitrophenolicus TaxID=683150 RepID=A0ACC6TFV8_9MICC|nr:hypothetical protein [Arthrobacter nitrophenolicus]ELT43193.1 hypothetical protein G205_19848 [Arthrobacter nitrophenolicus]
MAADEEKDPPVPADVEGKIPRKVHEPDPDDHGVTAGEQHSGSQSSGASQELSLNSERPRGLGESRDLSGYFTVWGIAK